MKRILRGILPGTVYDALLSAWRNARDLACDREVRREFLFRHPVSLFGRHPGLLYPKVLSLCLTTRCNLRCFICRRENVRGQDLEFGNLRKVENAIRHASVIDLTGWGECLLYPRFEDVVRRVYALNGRKDLIQIASNGTLLSANLARLLSGRLHRFVVSLNAATAETYRRDMRHGDFEKTLGHIRAFLEGLDGTDRRKVALKLVAHAANFREIPEFVRLAHELGISTVNIGQYLVGIPEHHAFALLNVQDEYNDVIDRAEGLGREQGVAVVARRFRSEGPRAAPACRDPFDSCFVEVDGQVGPCCFCGAYRIGNAFKDGFEAVWFGEGYARLRRERYLAACRTCAPFIPFDDPRAHFTAYFKETAEFDAICDIYCPRDTSGRGEV